MAIATRRASPPSRRLYWWIAGAGLGVILAGVVFVLVASSSSAPDPAPEGMVWIPAGQFWMGSEDAAFMDARPVHQVTLDGFWMDRTEVTNAQFAKFVEETGYKTFAEQPTDGTKAGSIVFKPPAGKVSLENPLVWWQFVDGANWRHPDGPGSSIEGKEKHPVVQVSWNDAAAYAKWAGKRLPTEAEWEYAARGGLDRQRFCWGDELLPGGKWQANIWQGDFPHENTKADGYERTAPVGSFPTNGFGLHDMSGNVWEWCADWYRPDYYRVSPERNPQGPESTTSYDPNEPDILKKVQRGGSFMCSDLYCIRYLPGGRGKGEPNSAAMHLGFRCVRSAH